MSLPAIVPNKVTRFFGKASLKFRKVRPEIFIVVGIGCGLAAIATTAYKSILAKDELVNDIHELKEAKKVGTNEEVIVTEVGEDGKPIAEVVRSAHKMTKEEKKQVWACRFKIGKTCFKYFWLPVTLESASIILIWLGRTFLRSDLADMTAMYLMATQAYKKLYYNVSEAYGEDRAQELAYGIKEIEGTDVLTDEKRKTKIIDKKANSGIYARKFDPGDFDEATGTWNWKNYAWDTDNIANRLLFIGLQRDIQDKVKAFGYVFWGYAAEKLGLHPEPNWYTCGWVYKPGEDNTVTFGVLDDGWQMACNKGFMDDRDPQNTCLVNPNIEYIGYVLEDIEKYDFRFGKRKRKRLPTNEEMFGSNYARKLIGTV